MKYDVSELDGCMLDASVYKSLSIEEMRVWGEIFSKGYFNPSNNWGYGGPIIERERIDLSCVSEDGNEFFWSAQIGIEASASGKTPLIAAMRAYVISKLGEWVEL